MTRHCADLMLCGAIVVCLFLAIGGIFSGLDKREAVLTGASGRKIDVAKVRKQISEGTLSGKNGLFYRKVGE